MTSIEIQNGIVTPYANSNECIRKTRHDEFDHPSQNDRLTQILHIINKRIKPEIENTIVVADVTGNCKPSFCILPKSHSTSKSLFTPNFQDSNSRIIQNFPRMISKRPFSYDFMIRHHCQLTQTMKQSLKMAKVYASTAESNFLMP